MVFMKKLVVAAASSVDFRKPTLMEDLRARDALAESIAEDFRSLNASFSKFIVTPAGKDECDTASPIIFALSQPDRWVEPCLAAIAGQIIFRDEQLAKIEESVRQIRRYEGGVVVASPALATQFANYHARQLGIRARFDDLKPAHAAVFRYSEKGLTRVACYTLPN